MARVPVTIAVADTAGNALAGISATVKNRATGANVILYVAETGATTTANPLTTDAYGRAFAWVDRVALRIDYAGTGIASYTENRDVGPSSDIGLDEAMLPAAAWVGHEDLKRDGAGPGYGMFSAYPSAVVGAATGVRKLICNTEEFDPSNVYDTTLGRHTPLVKGVYRYTAAVGFSTTTARQAVLLYKNGVNARYLKYTDLATTRQEYHGGTALLSMNGSTDYVELWVDTGGSISIAGSTPVDTFFQGELVAPQA